MLTLLTMPHITAPSPKPGSAPAPAHPNPPGYVPGESDLGEEDPGASADLIKDKEQGAQPGPGEPVPKP